VWRDFDGFGDHSGGVSSWVTLIERSNATSAIGTKQT
jgi:hypothetical protein